MNEKERTRISKFLSRVLRHQPGMIGLRLDAAGWVEVELLLAACGRQRFPISRKELDEVVATNEKKRFAFSDDGLRIRASQGHSIEVELGYAPQQPPEMLFHGTAAQFVESVRRDGLHKRGRQHVHLSTDEETARRVGARHGKPVILTVRAAAMASAGHDFFLSDNGVWLADSIHAEFIVFPKEHSYETA